MYKSKFPNKPGVYTLVIELADATTLQIGMLGTQRFPEGHYTYTGSALGERSTTLRNRVHRHLTRGKRKHWHIDYLLEVDVSRVKTVLFTETSDTIECPISTAVTRLEDAEIVVKGFGSSDCHGSCQSHLCFFPQTEYHDLVKRITSIYQPFGTPRHIET
jgi:sugar fermentation stimulation protein A